MEEILVLSQRSHPEKPAKKCWRPALVSPITNLQTSTICVHNEAAVGLSLLCGLMRPVGKIEELDIGLSMGVRVCATN